MKSIKEFLILSETNSLERKTVLLENMLSNLFAAKRPEGQLNDKTVLDFPEEELNHKFGEALKRLEAAKRGLGLTNKLDDPAQRKMHKRKVMVNLNRLRNLVKQIEAQLASDNAAVLGVDPASNVNQESVTSTEVTINEDAEKHDFNKQMEYLKSLEARKLTISKMLADNPSDTRLSKLLRTLVQKIKGLKATESVEEDDKVTHEGFHVIHKTTKSVHSKKHDSEEDAQKVADKMNADDKCSDYVVKPIVKLA